MGTLLVQLGVESGSAVAPFIPLPNFFMETSLPETAKEEIAFARLRVSMSYARHGKTRGTQVYAS